MLVMAIEAMRQLAAPDEHRISGYRLKNVHFLRAISINSSDRGTEAKIQMRPRKQATNNTVQGWYDWRIFTTSGFDWIECAYGSVKIEMHPKIRQGEEAGADDIASNNRHDRFVKTLGGEYSHDAESCTLGVHHSQFYQHIAEKSGYNYGPFFQQLRDIKYDRCGHASATLNLRGYMGQMPYAAEDPCVIHPTTLDCIAQAQMVALSQGGWQPIPTMMFSHLRELWVSHALFNVQGNPRLRIASHETMRTFREVECRTVVLLADSLEPVLVADGQRGTAITSLARSVGVGDDGASEMSYCIDYRPDLSLLTTQEVQDYLKSTFSDSEAIRPPSQENIDRADAIALYFVETVLNRFDHDGPRIIGNHLDKYVSWMRHVVANRDKWELKSRGAGHLNIQDVLREGDSEPSQRLGLKVGEHLYQVLTGKADALQVIFEGGLVEG